MQLCGRQSMMLQELPIMIFTNIVMSVAKVTKWMVLSTTQKICEHKLS